MGTFGTGPFSSDGALDFLGELAERAAGDRHDALGRRLRFVLDNPDQLWREYFPDEVVAAAALTAASLPDGASLDEDLSELVRQKLAADARLPAPAPDLARAALDALLQVAGPDGPWQQGWTSDTAAAEARLTVDALVAILERGHVVDLGHSRVIRDQTT